MAKSRSKAARLAEQQHMELSNALKTLAYIRGQYTDEQKAAPKIVALVAELGAKVATLRAALGLDAV
jgi:sulfur relay (sulfurtransferase) DsrC/TusE family protein